ncbi:hypothetical protein EON64_05600 [archaeon]|nr:MAG: hypothetical protein EON64_05600 [archaeon]
MDNFWPWVQNKAQPGTTFFGTQHFRSGANIAAPRDGIPTNADDAATDTIPDNEESAIPNTAATRRFGMQESYDYYQLCQRTERNRGLYTADQRINRNDRRGTRQNPNGNRHGFECPEERDYYPWWAPSPWIDIAVLTDSTGDNPCYPTDSTCSKRCQYYMQNTMNFNKKGYCDVSHNATGTTVNSKLNSQRWNQNRWYNNRDECETAGFTWYMVAHSDNLKLSNTSFVCAHTQYGRVNQLGNAAADTVISQNAPLSTGTVANKVNQGVNANRFLWTIPNIPVAKNGAAYFSDMTQAYQSCVLRMRYNISSADMQQWPIEAVNTGSPRMVDSANNSQGANDPRTPLRQNPYVYLGPGDSATKTDMFVKLKVNTNQYGRTFQDRSYVFAIKPLPTASTAASNLLDTPAMDVTTMRTALQNGGKIYNVNVRGKRGNIVQVYPSVEYDFVPNALAMSTNDMIHFQWTGSDYNPRRGCNDGTGGPPDANTFSTDANANQNPRADRSNVVLIQHMAFNVPQEYAGYTQNQNLSFSQKRKVSNSTILADAPCYNPATDSQATATACYNTLMRLAYLNQQSDLGSMTLRANLPCLTQAQLDAIPNQDVADFHPLNCAKLNAKPHPYFDGGLIFMRKSGWFPFFSSRNNNFSNRQQIGIICVGSNCKVDNSTGVLQDTNPQTNGLSVAKTASSTCYDTATGTKGSVNAGTTCLPKNVTATTKPLAVETFATQQGDNDATGDGNKAGCAVLTFGPLGDSVETDVALAIGLLFVGLFFAWLAYYLYNRYQARKESDARFKYDTAWQKAAPVEKSARPKSQNFSQSNPNVKLSRSTSPRAATRGASPVKFKSVPSEPTQEKVKPPKSNSTPKVQRIEMI